MFLVICNFHWTSLLLFLHEESCLISLVKLATRTGSGTTCVGAARQPFGLVGPHELSIDGGPASASLSRATPRIYHLHSCGHQSRPDWPHVFSLLGVWTARTAGDRRPCRWHHREYGLPAGVRTLSDAKWRNYSLITS